ncbi:MAG: DUF3887 domain-containing protein [Xenococcaceae cyanobacterium MO_188.B19]|nr:DUF3887 domain-containing protein [Xenococcaceae cyanobacterium MO_188.B19]
MKYRIQKLPHFSISLIIFATILNGTIALPLSNKAIAQLAQSNKAKSNELAKAEAVSQKFFDALIAGRFEQARTYLSPSIREYASAEDIEKQWQRILKKLGGFVKYRRIRPTESFDIYTVLVSANFENSISDFVVTLDQNQQISNVDFLWLNNIQDSAEEFVDALSNSKYGLARSYLAPKIKRDLLPQTIRQRWQDIVKTTGSFQRRSDSKVVEHSGSKVVLVDVEFQRENRRFMIIFNRLRQIVGVDFPQSDEQNRAVSQSDRAKSAQLAQAKKITQEFFDALVAGKFDQARKYLNPSIREYGSAEEIEEAWQKILKKLGAFVKYRRIRPTESFDTYTVLVSANFENSIPDFVVTLDRNQQISSVDFLWLDDIEDNAEEFVDALSKGKYTLAKSYFAPKIKQDLSPQTIQQRWQDIIKTTGSFQRRSDSKVVENSNSKVVLVDVEFEQENRRFLIIFNALGEIVGVDFPQS